MRLSDEQLRSYQEDGLLLLPELFSAEEVAAIKNAMKPLMEEESPSRVLEKGSSAVRALHGCHLAHDFFHRLTRHPALLEPARQVLESDVYVHQFKINTKAAFEGDIWEWHQDYIFWRNEDGIMDPRLVNISVFLDDVTEFNGPLLVVPGSQRHGVILLAGDEAPPEGYEDQPDWVSNLTADLKYSIGREQLAQLVEESGGIRAPKGPAGSVLLFHPNAVHGSAPNMSPWDRALLLVTYNSTENLPEPVANPRPDFLASRDFTPLQPLAAGEGL